MSDAAGYRAKAEQCLIASQQATSTMQRERYVAMAVTWLSLARQAEALEANGDARGWERLIENHSPNDP